MYEVTNSSVGAECLHDRSTSSDHDDDYDDHNDHDDPTDHDDTTDHDDPGPLYDPAQRGDDGNLPCRLPPGVVID